MENTKDNFIMSESVQKPLKELEDLNIQIKKKKQEVKKALFYAKHPQLKIAKEEFETKVAEEAAAKFNESLTEEPKREVKVPVREEVAPTVRKLTKEPAPIETPPVEIPKPAPVAAPLVVQFGGKWF